MVKRVVPVVLLLLAGGCSTGPDIIEFDTPLPGCADFAGTMGGLGMPGAPEVQGPPSSSAVGVNCVYSPAAQVRPPAVGAATVQISRPNFESDEKDPRKVFGGLLADTDCAGTAEEHPALPGGASCFELIGSTTATATVSAVTRQSGVRVSVTWSDPQAGAEKLKTDSLAKADALAQAVIAKL